MPAQQTLGSADIQNLRNLLTNDPMRAIQVLPGVTTGDDFHSEFAVRGSPFGRMNFTFDGIPTSFLLHTVPQVQDGGSIAMLNGDILDGITLLNGSYPQRYGNRLGAELDFHMREGSRDRTQMRVGVSGTDASIVVEGPLGRAKAGSWLVSAPQELPRAAAEADQRRRRRLRVRLQRRPVEAGLRPVAAASGSSSASWPAARASTISRRHPTTSTSSPTGATGRAGQRRRGGSPRRRASSSPSGSPLGAQVFRNMNAAGFELGRGAGARAHLADRLRRDAAPVASLSRAAGRSSRSTATKAREVFAGGPAPLVLTRYDDDATPGVGVRPGAWTRSARASATAGARVDHWSLTGDAEASPWLQGELRLTGRIEAARRHGHLPAVSRHSGSDRARTASRRSRHRARVSRRRRHRAVARQHPRDGSSRFYNREERDVLRLPASELRVVDGTDWSASRPTAPWVNTLDGYARGAELLVQRRSNSGL